MLRRPDTGWDDVVARLPELAQLSAEVAQQIVHDVKYEGYIRRQLEQVERQQRLARKRIPAQLDYDRLTHLRNEARQKLAHIRPVSR